MTKHEFMEYVKTHKKEITLGAACMVGTGVLIALGVKGFCSVKVSGNPVEMIGDIVSSVHIFSTHSTVYQVTIDISHY